MEGCADLGGCFYTKMGYQHKDSHHPGTNVTGCTATTDYMKTDTAMQQQLRLTPFIGCYNAVSENAA